MLLSEALGARDLLQVSGCFLLVAGPADRRQTIGIVGIITSLPQGQGRAMVEDEEAENQPRAAIRAAPLLPQHDLDLQLSRQVAPLAALRQFVAVEPPRPPSGYEQ